MQDSREKNFWNCCKVDMVRFPFAVTWNYRVLKRRQKDGSWTFGIHEVFYDDETGKPFAFTEEPMCPFGISFKEILQDMNHMLKDARKARPIDEKELLREIRRSTSRPKSRAGNGMSRAVTV